MERFGRTVYKVPKHLLSKLRWDIPPTDLLAKPGLMTILDLALYRSLEGELTATICSVHALLQAWLDLKSQARCLLKEFDINMPLARYALESSCDAIEKIATDRFATSANLSDTFESNAHSSSSSSTLSGFMSIEDSHHDTGRRIPKSQRRRDCWETSRLICPDYVWADDVFLTGQRLLRNLIKFIITNTSSLENLSSLDAEYQTNILISLIRKDLPMRLHQFRAATEANSVVLKRLYLVKTEYRAPFRAYVEAHQTVQRAPPLPMVNQYLEISSNRREDPESKVHHKDDDDLKHLLETPELIEALHIEKIVETLERKMAKSIFAYTELARLLENKKSRLTVVDGYLTPEEIQPMNDLLRRLRCCLCRKGGPETSSGIRPLLLDFQGLPRDEDKIHEMEKITLEDRISSFVQQLERLYSICHAKVAFVTDGRNENVDIPSSILKECAKLDFELWEAQCLDWFDLVRRQQNLTIDFDNLSDNIRKAEIKASITAANPESLLIVKERLERFIRDRELRFDILKDVIEDICLREMNWKINLQQVDASAVMELPSTSVLGLVGLTLKQAGEALPIG